jgi:hypothetical protein
MVISGPGVAGYQRNNVSTPPAAARDLAASRPGLGFHLIPVPVHHVDQGAHDEMPGQPRGEVDVIDQGPASRAATCARHSRMAGSRRAR